MTLNAIKHFNNIRESNRDEPSQFRFEMFAFDMIE